MTADALVAPHHSTPTGRPCILIAEPHRAQTVIDALRAGNYLRTACRLAGVSHDAVSEWLLRADTDTPDGPFTAFRDAIETAEAAAEDESIRGVRVAGEKDWKAHLAWLSRRHSARWAERSRETGLGASGVQIHVGIAISSASASQPVLEAQWTDVPTLPETPE